MSDAGDAPPPPLGPRTAATQVSAVVQAFRSSHGTISRSPTTVQTPAPSQVLLAVQTLPSSQAWPAGSNARRRAAITGHRVCRHRTARPDRGPRRPAADCAAARRAGQADRPAIASRSSRPSRSGANLAHGPGERHTCRRAIATTLRGCIVVSMKGCPPPRYGSQRTGLPATRAVTPPSARLTSLRRRGGDGAGGWWEARPGDGVRRRRLGHGDSRRARGVVRSTASGITRCAPPRAPRVDRGVLRARRGRWA